MTDHAPKAPVENATEMWSVDFTLSYDPDSLAPMWINCSASRREPGTLPGQWHHEGISSFQAPSLIPPKAGADLVPYLVYHLDEIKMWLTEEHVRRVFNGAELKIGPDVGQPAPATGIHPV